MYSKVLLLLFILVPLPAYSEASDFDKMCGYFEKLDNALTTKKMTKSQKAAFISKLVIENLEVNSSARKTWEVVLYAVPEERYEMVQSTATELLKKNWQCDVMKKYISMTGE